MVIDPRMNFVYVADIENAMIQKFDTYGSYLSEWVVASIGDGESDHLGDIAIDPSI